MAPLAAPRGLGLVEEYRRLRAITEAPAKVPVPGPFTLAGCLQGGEVYRDRLAVTEALIPVVNRELKDLAAEGVTFLQLDEPSFACHPDQPEQFLDLIARTVLSPSELPVGVITAVCGAPFFIYLLHRRRRSP